MRVIEYRMRLTRTPVAIIEDDTVPEATDYFVPLVARALVAENEDAELIDVTIDGIAEQIKRKLKEEINAGMEN